jgi:hypothetical protein
LKELATIKVDAYLFDMVTILEQQRHLKDFMEGETSTISSLIEEWNKEGMYINKVGVYNPMSYVKNHPFYVFVKIMEKIAQCCLIDGGSSPNVMSNFITKDLGLSCKNENSKTMLSYNSQQQAIVGEIKDVNLVLCAHPQMRITCNI